MSQTTFNFELSVGNPSLLTLVELCDPDATFGVQRQDTLAIVVPAATAFVADSSTLFHYTFTDSVPGLTYTAWVHWIYDGDDKYNQQIKRGGGDLLPRYLDLDAAAVLAASVPGLTAWTAASSPQQYAALMLATGDIDGTMRYQGRKYDLQQPLQFPRVAYEPSRESDPFQGRGLDSTALPLVMNGLSGGARVWDFDPTTQTAVVPASVKIACLYQANDRLSGKRAKLINQLYDGLTAQAIGTGSESYDLAAALKLNGTTLALCREASQLLQKYRLRQGGIL